MKLLRIAMLVVFVFAGMLSASANPSGSVPKNEIVNEVIS